MQSMLDHVHTDAHSARLDHLIAQVHPHDLLLEHLRSARICVLGAMPNEYLTALQLARDASLELPDAILRDKLGRVIGSLVSEAQSAKPPRTETSDLASFFENRPTEHGLFHPNQFIIAALPSHEAARSAGVYLRSLIESAVLAVRGQDFVRYLASIRVKAGLWGELMTLVSRFFHTEAALVDQDLEEARHGAGFLVIHAPEGTDTARIRDLLRPFSPLAITWYLPSGVQTLI